MNKENIKSEIKLFAVETIGCRLNQYETEKMANQLSHHGLKRVDFSQDADLYLINTCTVTGRADSSCRNSIARAVKQGDEAIVVVIGCYVDSDPHKTAQLNGVDLVVGNKDKTNIAKILSAEFPFLFKKEEVTVLPEALPEFYQHSRTWVKISDGCNQRCAYCIIPKVRGKLINRPASEIIEEINLLSKNGYHEVVLTGVHIGQYSWDKVKSIADLTQYILDNTDISRLRLSSIEPQEVNSDLVSVIKNGGRRVCRYLHIPLQSGSDRILKLMHRPYSINDYINKLQSVKESIDGIIIGADIIVGFPGESENNFNESVKIAQSGMIDYLHVFSYSDRPGTESSVMPDKISSKVIKKRSKILRDISDINYKSALQKEIGKTVYAVSESGTNKSGKHYWGITDNFLKIILPEKLGDDRKIVKLKVTGAKDKYLIGTF
ncbi:MAG: tRNA (N(6)-L-threonylcarbamoyladenosine(37)-C(2))-methylthiotransferase MtaB [candidate division Zixibacteria bacterium]|nr:tRNA (N(6)-L-threonylcarbamoyladenosine(37)-C(2))-methylthiotransferase MtaB [candidate division Zixibacteria bacterium]